MEPNLVQYIPIAVLLGIALFFALLLPILSLSLGPKRLGQRALMPYESGMTPIGEAQRRLPVKFYRIAVLFILFDVEVLFMYPWAVSFGSTVTEGRLLDPSAGSGMHKVLLFEAAAFVAILFLGWAYVVKKGVLEWHKEE